MPVVDDGVGQLIAALRETGQVENTLVVYSADQGFAMGEHGCRMKVAPYDANYRSPFIVSMPGKVAQGKVCPQVVSSVDLVTTFFAFAGLDQPWKFHGHDITPLLHDPAAAWPHPCLYRNTSTRARDSSAALSSKDGFSVVAPTSTTVPSSITGRKESCWARLKRCTSSTNNSVPLPVSRRARAASKAFLRSATPENTADNCSKCRSVASAMSRATVVLPVPGGPQKTSEPSDRVSSMRVSAPSGPSR